MCRVAPWYSDHVRVALVSAQMLPCTFAAARSLAALALLSLAACLLPTRELGANVESCEDGACECQVGFDTCNGAGDDGCETDLSTDADNCGWCQRSCQGGGCLNARCEPLTLFEAPAGAYLRMRVGASYLFWAPGSESVGTATEDTTLWAMILQGGEPVLVVGDPATRVGWTVSGDTVYSYGEGANDAEIVVYSATVGSSQRVVGSWHSETEFVWVASFVADEEHVYLGTGDGLLEMEIDTGSTTRLLADDFSLAMTTLTEGTLLWTTFEDPSVLHALDLVSRERRSYPTGAPNLGNGAVLTASTTHAFATTGDGYVHQIALDSGETTELGPLEDEACALAADESWVYAGQCQLGTIVRLPVGGGPPETLVTGQESPGSLAPSARSLYFVTTKGIMRLGL